MEAGEQALASTSDFYGWMLCGEALYGELARHGYALAQSADELLHRRCCFETFPHAITVQLHRAFGLEPAAAARKRQERRSRDSPIGPRHQTRISVRSTLIGRNCRINSALESAV